MLEVRKTKWLTPPPLFSSSISLLANLEDTQPMDKTRDAQPSEKGRTNNMSISDKRERERGRERHTQTERQRSCVFVRSPNGREKRKFQFSEFRFLSCYVLKKREDHSARQSTCATSRIGNTRSEAHPIRSVTPPEFLPELVSTSFIASYGRSPSNGKNKKVSDSHISIRFVKLNEWDLIRSIHWKLRKLAPFVGQCFLMRGGARCGLMSRESTNFFKKITLFFNNYLYINT